ncbi:MAG: arginine--tRNA ligase [Chitinophagaceae bacterium]|nr:arginine--tRNA ligase [Chitinophagaceae bacterium]
MGIVRVIQEAVAGEIKNAFQLEMAAEDIQVSETKPDFDGDYTVVLFALTKSLKKAPEALGRELGEKMVNTHSHLFSSFNVIKGFLNLSISDRYWLQFLKESHSTEYYGFKTKGGRKVMVEYSSPNTNKPLHLGHLRNNFLGWSIAAIFEANGSDVVKTCIVNDRGIHICKSMLAWKKFGNGETPESTGLKGDHFVGNFYVAFENELRKQSEPLLQKIMQGEPAACSEEDQKKLGLFLDRLEQSSGNEEKTKELMDEIRELVRNNTPIMQEVREMLLKWEQGDEETIALWRTMNGWVYAGFDTTYKRIGSDFDKTYYESETYLLGKHFVEQGLSKGVFIRREDGSVWIDLTAKGLDEKLLLRRDGTSVYITQDLGLAKQKYDDYKIDQSIYVIGDEQNYHMKVLKLICQKLQIPNADNIYHLSYGMVELPGGRMKSREGTVVDADDIVTEMESIAANHTQELGKVKDFTDEELKDLYYILGVGALKFFLLRVDPKKRMIFNPEESIEFHGFTGPFIQYTFARTKSILRKEQPRNILQELPLLPLEKNVIIELEKYPTTIEQASHEMNPSVIANYIFGLAQVFNSFVTELRILTAETEDKKELRLQLAQMTVNVIKSGMGLLGIKVPERM